MYCSICLCEWYTRVQLKELGNPALQKKKKKEKSSLSFFPPSLFDPAEEILESNSACWFSPDSSKLTYLQLNDSSVQEIQLPLYYDPYGESRYVRRARVRYPKAGSRNPEAAVRLVDLSRPGDERSFDVRPPPVIAKGYQYALNVVLGALDTWPIYSVMAKSIGKSS